MPLANYGAAMQGLSRARQPFNPNLSMLDNGRAYDTSRLSAGGLQTIGMQQEDLRHGEESAQDWQSGRAVRTNQNAVGDTGNNMRGYFGALQARANAVEGQGKNLKVDFAGQPGSRQNSGWGTWGYQTDGGVRRNLTDDVRTAPDRSHPAFQALAGVRRYR
jgi:hypothetical protein